MYDTLQTTNPLTRSDDVTMIDVGHSAVPGYSTFLHYTIKLYGGSYISAYVLLIFIEFRDKDQM